MDQAVTAWDTMLVDANDTQRAASRRRTIGSVAIDVLRTIGLLALVALAILVLLPAMIAAQPTFLG